jgi:hypothetical protein
MSSHSKKLIAVIGLHLGARALSRPIPVCQEHHVIELVIAFLFPEPTCLT